MIQKAKFPSAPGPGTHTATNLAKLLLFCSRLRPQRLLDNETLWWPSLLMDLLLRQWRVDLRHSEQFLDLHDHTGGLGGYWVVNGLHSLAQTESFEDAVLALRHTDTGADEGDFEERHSAERVSV